MQAALLGELDGKAVRFAELLIFCGCSRGERSEGRWLEKEIEDDVVRMQFGHWVPLLVHTALKSLPRTTKQQALLKMEIFAHKILKAFVLRAKCFP